MIETSLDDQDFRAVPHRLHGIVIFYETPYKWVFLGHGGWSCDFVAHTNYPECMREHSRCLVLALNVA